MFELEIIIMIISIWPKPYFLYNNFGRFCLDFLLFLFLLIKKFLIINNFTNRRFRVRGNFNKIEFHFVCQSEGILDTHDFRFYLITYNSDHFGSDPVVNFVSRLDNPAGASSDWSGYNLFLLIFVNTKADYV